MPLSITGAHRGSYRKINPQLSQTIESASIIIKSLNKAQDDWWKKTKISENLIHEEDSEGEHESDEEEMVDLQMHEKKEIESETFF